MSLLPQERAVEVREPVEQPPTFSRRQGVLLINLGTPDAPDLASVRTYLSEFLSDPAVIQLPSYLRWLNRPLGRLIARYRAPRSAAMYRRIWTERGSPLGSITSEQALALAATLPPGWQVFHAMRYGRPSIAQTLEQIEAAGVERLVVVPMYPQFSGTTTGTAARELYGCLERGGRHLNVSIRNSWCDDAGYVYAQAKLIQQYARAHGLTPENSVLVFSAHGLPVSYVERGDPYPDHVRRSVELVLKRLGWPADRTTLAYQSRLGPAKWLEPKLDETLQTLARGGEKRLLVCPISFTVDCLDTLEEIDLRYRGLVEACGGDLFLCPALNAFAPFIAALKELVLRGPRATNRSASKLGPLLAASARVPSSDGVRVLPRTQDHDNLVMIGASMASRMGSGLGPELLESTDAALHAAKIPTCETPELLRGICAEGAIREAFLWNTCFRFEFYGWLAEGADPGERERAIDQVRRRLFGDDWGRNGNLVPSDQPRVNVLVGGDAWHHLMRTASGLNSGLPGDSDVLEQLRTAQRVAQRGGTAGQSVEQLIQDAVSLERDVRAKTAWGEFDAGYCQAALSRVVDATGLDLRAARCVVLGGSTTSRSVLTTLARRFDVPTRQMTLIYRGHGSGQIKLLRKAIGHGTRLRVGSYGDASVIKAIADADVVVFGIDTEQTVLDAGRAGELRDLTKRPLTIIDFNTFGSTIGLEMTQGVTVFGARQLDDEVQALGQALCASERFAQAGEEAERWIVEQKPIRQCRVAPRPTPAVCRDCSHPIGLCAVGAVGSDRP